VPFVLTYGPSHLKVPAPINPDAALKDTEEFWSEWSGRCTYKGEHRDLVMRSLITLKALTFAPSGGIVAAPTTSLPEKLGGARNWDYRFCWVRDATFTLLVLMNSGYTEEARDWHNWLLRAVAGSPAEMQIMYGIMGQRRLLEWEADWLPGYGGALPVRVGNAAHAQLQLDVYGELVDSFYQTRVAKLELDGDTWAVECEILEHLTAVWQQPDHGIWERRGNGKHYVFSKMMCWVAFDRAIKSAEKFGLKGPVEAWRKLRDEIHSDVCEKGFDPRENTFVESYGSDVLDASILLLPLVGFLPADDPRVKGTVAAIEKHMIREGFVLRHDPREFTDEIQPIEGAFLACTLWLAEVHIKMGEIDRAEELFNRVVSIVNDVGLVAEEYDPLAKRQAGNFPQALTHIALIAVAQNLAGAKKPADKPAMERAK
jgi:GH15 family glucan-1,4-alpha-glucosidase